MDGLAGEDGAEIRAQGRSGRDHRLPRGRHRLSAEEVAANQRWRLIAAAGALVARDGVGTVTGGAIAREAGVSSSTLYRLFAGADGVLLAAFEAAAASLSEVVADARAATREGGAAAALVAACEWASREPGSAALLGTGPAVALSEVAVARDRLVESLSSTLVALPGGHEGDPEALRRLSAAAVLTTLAERAMRMRPAEARGLGHELAALIG